MPEEEGNCTKEDVGFSPWPSWGCWWQKKPSILCTAQSEFCFASAAAFCRGMGVCEGGYLSPPGILKVFVYLYLVSLCACRKLHDSCPATEAISRIKATSLLHQLLCACHQQHISWPYLLILSRYSSVLASVTQVLQSVKLDVMEMKVYVYQELLVVMEQHRKTSEETFSAITENNKKLAGDMEKELKAPRETVQPKTPANHLNQSTGQWSIYIPYLYSLITSPTTCFGDENQNGIQFVGNYIHLRYTTLKKKTFKLFRNLKTLGMSCGPKKKRKYQRNIPVII